MISLRKACISIGLIFGALVSYAQREVNTSMSYDATAEAKATIVFYDAMKALMEEKNTAAEDLFLQFLKLKPDEPAAYFELSKINQELNKPEKAEDYIKKAIELDSTNKWYMEQYASVLTGRNDFAGAAALLDRIAKKERHNKDYLMGAAIFYQRAGKNTEALYDLNKVLAYDLDEDALIRKQQIFAKMNLVDSSAVVIQQLISLDPQQGKYYALLAELYDQSRQPEKAMKVYEQALQKVPDDLGVQLSLAEHYRKVQDSSKFIFYIKKAITNRQIDVETQVDLLYSYIRTLPEQQKGPQGLALIEEIVRQRPNNARVLEAYGDILVLNKNIDTAIAQYKRSVAIDPSKMRVWEQVLRGYAEKKSDADSLIFYSQKALRLFPNQASIHYIYGIGLMNKKQYSEAVKAIDRAIDMQPDEDTAMLASMYALLGDIYNTLKQYDLSDSALNHALRLQPKDAGVLNNYAYYLSVRYERLEDAERMSRMSLMLQPGTATFLDTYGWIMYKEKKYDKAKEYVEKAILADPNADGTVWAHLGDIYFQLGDKDKALECWIKAKQKNTDDPLIDKKISEKKLYE